MAAVVNSLHACDAALGVEAWFEWVPSHANVSVRPRELVLPTVGQLNDPSVMVAASRALAAGVAADKQRAVDLLRGLIGGPP